MKKRQTVLQKVKAYLDKFTSPDSIATACKRAKVTGTRGDNEGCALALLLAKKFKRPFWIGYAVVSDGTGDFMLPEIASEFVGAFDGRQYPELLRSEVETRPA